MNPEFSPPPSTAGDASFFRSGSGEGLSELVMGFPAVLGVFLTVSLVRFWGNPEQHMKLQQPRNYDFGMFQFNLLGPQEVTAVK